MPKSKAADDTAALEDVFASGRDRNQEADNTQNDMQPGDGQQQLAGGDGQQQNDRQQQVRDPETGNMVPLSELQAERQKRKAKDDELSSLRAELEKRDREYREQMAELRGRISATPQPQQRQAPPPSPLEDPEGAFAYLSSHLAQQRFNDVLDYSEGRARDKYGDTVVDAAMKEAQARGLIQQGFFLQTNPRHPWGALVEWHKREMALAQIGDDPDAYAKKVREQVQAQILEDLKAGKLTTNGVAHQPGAAPQQQRFPGTLAGQTGAGMQGALPQSDEAMAADVFGSERASRQRK